MGGPPRALRVPGPRSARPTDGEAAPGGHRIDQLSHGGVPRRWSSFGGIETSTADAGPSGAGSGSGLWSRPRTPLSLRDAAVHLHASNPIHELAAKLRAEPWTHSPGV